MSEKNEDIIFYYNILCKIIDIIYEITISHVNNCILHDMCIIFDNKFSNIFLEKIVEIEKKLVDYEKKNEQLTKYITQPGSTTIYLYYFNIYNHISNKIKEQANNFFVNFNIDYMIINNIYSVDIDNIYFKLLCYYYICYTEYDKSVKEKKNNENIDNVEQNKKRFYNIFETHFLAQYLSHRYCVFTIFFDIHINKKINSIVKYFDKKNHECSFIYSILSYSYIMFGMLEGINVDLNLIKSMDDTIKNINKVCEIESNYLFEKKEGYIGIYDIVLKTGLDNISQFFVNSYVENVKKITNYNIVFSVEKLEENTICLYTLYKKENNYSHASVLISENDIVYLFCPNGYYDFDYYSENIKKDTEGKILKKVLLNYDLENENINECINALYKKKDIENLQGSTYSTSSILSTTSSDTGTCMLWSFLFIDLYIKIKLVDKIYTPIDTYRYILFNYNDPKKLHCLIDDFSDYFLNIETFVLNAKSLKNLCAKSDNICKSENFNKLLDVSECKKI